VQLPLTSLAEDVAWTRHMLAERLPGPTVLAGHSYGGAVISGAATGVENVIVLVFASAFAPDEVSAWVRSTPSSRRRLARPTPSPTRWAFCGSTRRGRRRGRRCRRGSWSPPRTG
jgi:pimeloyl-ACP methyl ester carboxylesterase